MAIAIPPKKQALKHSPITRCSIHNSPFSKYHYYDEAPSRDIDTDTVCVCVCVCLSGSVLLNEDVIYSNQRL